MPLPDLLDKGLGLAGASDHHYLQIVVRLLCTLVLASLLAFRPWRRLAGKPPMKTETAEAQVLIAVAGAVMVAIIGDSVARAFGLVGLGGFIRFRSGIKDPRDAAVMFVMIGVGMACGIGVVPVAVVASAFAAGVLAVFDMVGTVSPERRRVVLQVDDATSALAGVRRLWPAARVLAAPTRGTGPQRLVLEMDLAESVDAASLLQSTKLAGIDGVLDVEIGND
jgi:uncharacterized membrane protein YhiD involved in acid resistance